MCSIVILKSYKDMNRILKTGCAGHRSVHFTIGRSHTVPNFKGITLFYSLKGVKEIILLLILIRSFLEMKMVNSGFQNWQTDRRT